MDSRIKIKQEVLSELASQNETEIFPKDLALNKNNATIIWYNNCEMGMKTEMKLEASAPGCFSQDESQMLAKDSLKRIKIDIFTYNNDMEMDIKTDIASAIYSENKQQGFPKDGINKMECTSDYEIDIKEEPWWLERIAQASLDYEQIQDGRNAVELPRKDINFNPRWTSSELNQIRKSDSHIRKTFSIEESSCSEHPDLHGDSEILSIACIEQNNLYGCDSNKNNMSNVVQLNLTDRCGKACKCDTCHKSYNQLSKLKQHSSVHEAADVHKCQVCERAFTRKSDLKRHKQIHEGIKPYKCKICMKTFTRLHDLKHHNLIHKGAKPHKCEICMKTYTKMSHLKQHNLIHEGVKPHKCTVCEKAFTRLSTLKQHYLIHESVKPHKCEICMKTFTKVAYLKQHNFIHEGLKPHKCKFCNKAFTDLSTLKQHCLIHEGLKPYKCEICMKTFTRKSHLNQHNFIHQGVKPYKCQICIQTFTQRSHLNRHNLIHEVH